MIWQPYQKERFMLKTDLLLILLVSHPIIQILGGGQWGNLMEVMITVVTGLIIHKTQIKINQDPDLIIQDQAKENLTYS